MRCFGGHHRIELRCEPAAVQRLRPGRQMHGRRPTRVRATARARPGPVQRGPGLATLRPARGPRRGECRRQRGGGNPDLRRQRTPPLRRLRPRLADRRRPERPGGHGRQGAMTHRADLATAPADRHRAVTILVCSPSVPWAGGPLAVLVLGVIVGVGIEPGPGIRLARRVGGVAAGPSRRHHRSRLRLRRLSCACPSAAFPSAVLGGRHASSGDHGWRETVSHTRRS